MRSETSCCCVSANKPSLKLITRIFQNVHSKLKVHQRLRFHTIHSYLPHNLRCSGCWHRKRKENGLFSSQMIHCDTLCSNIGAVFRETVTSARNMNLWASHLNAQQSQTIRRFCCFVSMCWLWKKFLYPKQNWKTTESNVNQISLQIKIAARKNDASPLFSFNFTLTQNITENTVYYIY